MEQVELCSLALKITRQHEKPTLHALDDAAPIYTSLAVSFDKT